MVLLMQIQRCVTANEREGGAKNKERLLLEDAAPIAKVEETEGAGKEDERNSERQERCLIIM